MNTFIHLLYVPTMNCNMRCRYCYLGDGTTDDACDKTPLDTLAFAVQKLENSGVVPFNISLHGGEVTTLSHDDFREVAAFIDDYYRTRGDLLTQNGFRVGHVHIKTNLLGIDKHLDTIADYNISISGSLDLPLSLHRAHRITKGGGETLTKILDNIRLLEALPNRKKVSATLFHEHVEHMDELIADIRFLHEHTCLDMNDFNFMIGFACDDAGEVTLTPMTEDEQVALFDRMQQEFTGTDLQEGLDNAWFAEFTQGYCTNCDLCGEKFFLLERNGDIYSCVRGQRHPDFYYGNIYTDTVEDILHRGKEQCLKAHSRVGFDPACAACDRLYLCKTGCPFVKNVYHSPKSYTCRLQQRIYDKNNEPAGTPNDAFAYLSKLHPSLAAAYYKPSFEDGGLSALIAADKKLQAVYDDNAFLLVADGDTYPLHSQLLKPVRDILFLTDQSRVTLYVRCDVMNALADYPVNNALYMMLLSGNTIIYGDEQREKQEHIMTHQIFTSTLARTPSDRDGYYRVDLMPLLRPYFHALAEDMPNNLFFTTTALRDYHYTKQKNNGFYHIAAINLPFQNIEFHYIDIKKELPYEYDSTQNLP